MGVVRLVLGAFGEDYLTVNVVLYAVGVARLILGVYGDGFTTANVHELLGFVPLVFTQVAFLVCLFVFRLFTY